MDYLLNRIKNTHTNNDDLPQNFEEHLNNAYCGLSFVCPSDKEKEIEEPLFGTQGGGVVKFENGIYIFIEKPDCPGLDVGDKLPDQWSIVPINS